MLLCRNPVFLTVVHKTLQCMREAIFGDGFWKEFTQTARQFDQSTQDEIFFSLHVSVEAFRCCQHRISLP